MYHGTLKKPIFQPDPASMIYEKQRQEYVERLMAEQESPPLPSPVEETREERSRDEEGILQMLEQICPEDGALIALILFLLCDNTENDVVLLGILLYVLLAKDRVG